MSLEYCYHKKRNQVDLIVGIGNFMALEVIKKIDYGFDSNTLWK